MSQDIGIHRAPLHDRCPQAVTTQSRHSLGSAHDQEMDRDLVLLRPYLDTQAGVFTRVQALAVGLTRKAIEANLVARRWQRVLDGVFAAFTGDLNARQRAWAALLWAGPGAALADISALRWQGFSGGEDTVVHISVDHGRRVTEPPGVALSRRSRIDEFVVPNRRPRRLRLEDAALHRASRLGISTDGLSVLVDVCRERLTTPGRLRSSLSLLPRLQERKVMWAILDDVAQGAHSFLEFTYLRDVERAHVLPRPQRQARAEGVHVVGAVNAGNVWRDGLYDQFALVLELDGRLGHETAADRHADRVRDARAAGEGLLTLRHGYSEVVCTPCSTAALVARVLRARGWTGAPLPCRVDCVAPALSAGHVGTRSA